MYWRKHNEDIGQTLGVLNIFNVEVSLAEFHQQQIKILCSSDKWFEINLFLCRFDEEELEHHLQYNFCTKVNPYMLNMHNNQNRLKQEKKVGDCVLCLHKSQISLELTKNTHHTHPNGLRCVHTTTSIDKTGSEKNHCTHSLAEQVWLKLMMVYFHRLQMPSGSVICTSFVVVRTQPMLEKWKTMSA